MRRRHVALVLVALFALGAILSACHGHDVPTLPGSSRATLETLWPYRDGLGWSYRVLGRGFDGGVEPVYATPGEVPDAPGMAEIVSRLEQPTIPPVLSRDSSSYVLRFDGMITTGSGVRRPNLTETWIRAGLPKRSAGDPLLAALWRARPDLRPRLAARFAALAPADTIHWYAALLLHGYAWEKNDEWIGTYGDVDTLPAWKYLVARLAPGSEFTHQLVPALASDVFLHGRMMEPATVATPLSTYRNASRCAYLVDYGVMTHVDQYGNTIGYSRTYDYGMVAYARNVGPVACYERRRVSAGRDGGWGDVTLDLTGTGSTPRVPPAPVADAARR